jgi:ATP-dependent helicase/DNAse subunit B
LYQGEQEHTKYNAVWLSHSSISDYLKCPRLYYLRNIWKNKNGQKINTVSPSLSLGSAVHQTIEPLALLKTEERLSQPLLNIFENIWTKFQGEMGGFTDQETEDFYKQEAIRMLQNVIDNPGPISRKTVKFYNGDFIPNIYLSEKDNIILCGLVDWVEYEEATDTLRVIDFKTGKNDEKEDSMQLPIYKILVEALQKRKVSKGAYWYLARDKFPKNVEILDEDIEEIKKKILEVGLQIKKRKSEKNLDQSFACKYEGGCYACRQLELIKQHDEEPEKVSGVKYLGTGEYKQALYMIADVEEKIKETQDA